MPVICFNLIKKDNAAGSIDKRKEVAIGSEYSDAIEALTADMPSNVLEITPYDLKKRAMEAGNAEGVR